MKITNSVRRLYDEQLPLNVRLATRVKQLFEDAKPDDWFYRGRVKEIESFAQKLETGRGGHPSAQEDFFACTLVVENRTAVQSARRFVERFCELVDERPSTVGLTHKSADSFQFDDLRLYVKLRSMRPDEPIDAILFEVQIKTFLQHAWGIATRDLIYKGDRIDWGKARVAYQVKAMLEHAEVSIAEVEVFAKSEALALIDPDTSTRNAVLKWLTETWLPEQLPSDRRRLVDNMLQVARILYIDIEDVMSLIDEETVKGEGKSILNLSPYGIMIRTLFKRRSNKVVSFLTKRDDEKKKKKPHKLLLTEEMDVGPLPNQANPERYYYLSLADPALFAPEESPEPHVSAQDDSS